MAGLMASSASLTTLAKINLKRQPVAVAFLPVPPPGLERIGHAAAELESLVATMIQLRYLRSEEIPKLPHRQQPMQVAAYAPLDRATFAADIVIFRGNSRQIMLLSEAARAAGVSEAAAAMGRPAGAMIPHAIDSASAVASLGCIGNRVYTELGDDELYLTVPGSALTATLNQLETILTANSELEKFHRQRAASLS